MTVSSIQSWASEVQATLTSLPSQLEEVAPSGGFASVLAEVAAELGAGPGVDSSTATAAASSTAVEAADGTAGTATESATAGSTVSTAGGVTGEDIVAEAEKFLGVPYVWGGETPDVGFDCSGLVQYVYRQFGITLPRTTYTQVDVGTPVASITEAQPGDLVFFAGSDGTTTSPGHVGIYIGNGEMIDAPYTGAVVRIDPVGDPVAIRQIVPATTTATSATSDTSAASATSTSVTATSVTATGDPAVPSDLAPLFVAAAGQYGVPVQLLTAVAYHESGYDTSAVSTAGAEGLMQIMPTTAAGLGITPFTPAEAIDGAAQLLSGYIQQFGSVPLALAAYNAGPGAVEEYGGIPPYAQTEAYVETIMQKLGGSA